MTNGSEIFKNETMTSLEIAEVTGKRHSDVLEAIRKMEPAWEKIAQRKFPLGTYTDANNQGRPCYVLNKTECLYIATKFNDEARAKLILRWEELETKEVSLIKVPTTFAEALRLAADQAEKLEAQEKMLEASSKEIVELSGTSLPCGQRSPMLIRFLPVRRPNYYSDSARLRTICKGIQYSSQKLWHST